MRSKSRVAVVAAIVVAFTALICTGSARAQNVVQIQIAGNCNQVQNVGISQQIQQIQMLQMQIVAVTPPPPIVYYYEPTPQPVCRPSWSYLNVRCWGPCSRFFIDAQGRRWDQEGYRKVPSTDVRLRGRYYSGSDGRTRFVAVWPSGETRTFVDP